ncbi:MULTISPECIES: GNAT family N-acetyltransferase [Cyanophyceae]|uniref:GNAT family N-acetyltransferase n=1 Tax=Cyanophyceae TaxID=3028117 RepID=UPI001686B9F7|nr:MULTISPECIES: GNAT family N-acetyltransferase [Cyanophyceae]MBD1918223.1 GNAT family N-acetyltransferase [Phormidium sp. FACHB-77]MBD2030255.1 GNAT family N-acetyltransferase [Phormidium sp. FACHB-322]MBD2051373.1 GNAT family N-acetyltransferase [Leptolyngbya sp. FACHB-60]
MSLPSPITIRASNTTEDAVIAEHFYRMWRDLGVSEGNIQPNWLDISLDFVQTARHNLDYQTFVAIAEGAIVGSVSGQRFAGLYPPILLPTHRQYGYIWGVYVEPAYRNQGVATRLTRLMVDYLRGIGCTKIVLNAAPKARSLYQKLGFSESNLMELNLVSQEG